MLIPSFSASSRAIGSQVSAFTAACGLFSIASSSSKGSEAWYRVVWSSVSDTSSSALFVYPFASSSCVNPLFAKEVFSCAVLFSVISCFSSGVSVASFTLASKTSPSTRFGTLTTFYSSLICSVKLHLPNKKTKVYSFIYVTKRKVFGEMIVGC